MSTEAVPAGGYAVATQDGFTVETNTETAESLKENLSESTAKPLDGPPPDPEKEEADKVSKAASELGKRGGKAAAEKRAAEPKEVEQEADPDPEPEKSEDGKKKGPFSELRARMKDATRDAAEARRERDAERERAAALERRIQALEQRQSQGQQAPTPKPQAPADPNKPKVGDYANYEDFVEALADYKADQKLKTTQREASQVNRVNQVHNEVNTWKRTWYERMESAAKADPQLTSKFSSDVIELMPTYDAMLRGKQVDARNSMADEIIDSDKAPQIMVYLSENPDEFQRLARLRSPRDVAREMAKIESKLDSQRESAPTGSTLKAGSSTAKPPGKPVPSSPNTAPPEGSDDESLDVYIKRENARERQARAGR